MHQPSLFLAISPGRARATVRYGRMISVIQSSRTLCEAMTKKGRCSVFRQRPFDVSAATGCCRVFASGQWVIIANIGSAGKNRNSPSTPRFLSTKPQVARIQNGGLFDRSRFFTALPESSAGSMRQILEPPSTTAFPHKETAGRSVATFRCTRHV